MQKITKCSAYSSTSIAHKFVVQGRHYGIEEILNLDIGNECGLVFESPMPDDELAKYYPEDTFYAYPEPF